MSAIDVREIEAFLAVADELHFGRAAHRLHMTPSNVSQRIRALEQRVGAPVFDRTSRWVRLTPIGQRLLDDWRPAFHQLTRGLDTARHVAGAVASNVRAGYTITLPGYIREGLSSAFEVATPGSRLVWLQDRMYDMYMWNHGSGHELDVALLWLPPGARRLGNLFLTTGPALYKAQAALVVPPGHPFEGRTSVDAEELADQPIIDHRSMMGIGTSWVPALTPAGRPIERVEQTTKHLESFIDTAIDQQLIHLTHATIADTPAWDLLRDRAELIHVEGLQPFTLHTFWPAIASSRLAAEFSILCARTGRRAGWLDVDHTAIM
ncbi:LysR family transcriptional regulator [Nocardia sp. NEAU-G5]|uniref:LysR family transcriptional regulator n=1 Tax=Nocardia albiluteola TaxID=2842303 RepID=A0ABS6APZ6_9NOCA|nr:LysR family transcriptional regulator [Nocardia albiluteola]MBU3060078.1 LysR family transcriptional regulator [Nocardia albiluteola]